MKTDKEWEDELNSAVEAMMALVLRSRSKTKEGRALIARKAIAKARRKNEKLKGITCRPVPESTDKEPLDYFKGSERVFISKTLTSKGKYRFHTSGPGKYCIIAHDAEDKQAWLQQMQTRKSRELYQEYSGLIEEEVYRDKPPRPRSTPDGTP